MTLYAYIMTSDTGYAPNPSRGVCTLAYCMPSTRGKAQEGDYVLGLGGREYRKQVGDWHIIYAMKVTETLSLDEHAKRFPGRPMEEQVKTDRALVSNDFVYWGKKARILPSSLDFLAEAFYSNGVLSGISHRFGFSAEEVQAFKRWFSKQKKGKQGEPFEYVGPRRNC